MKKLVYNKETLSYELASSPKWLKVTMRVATVLAGAAMVVLYVWLYLGVFKFELPKTAILRKKNARYAARLNVIERRIDMCDAILSGVEERDDDVFRSIYGLGEVPKSSKDQGFEGQTRYTYLDELGAGSTLRHTVKRMDAMMKRTAVQSTALDEVSSVARQAGDMVACIPAVPPLCPTKNAFHLSSPFGFRSDPVYGGTAFHKGQDFAGPVGLPVYATGDGVVESVRFQYSGYGNEVIINHGFGYTTRYAHLNSVNVGVGQKLKRGDQVGELGKSGKSTGPHLHYEVLYRDIQVNPMSFMDLSMSVDEYKAMVDKRRAERHLNQPTASELTDRIKRMRNGQ